MFTVSLIGPDGVGKTTIAKELETSFPLPTKYLYMGINAASSNYMLPTTRWWAKRNKQRKPSKESMESNACERQSKEELPGNHKSSKGKVERKARVKELFEVPTLQRSARKGVIRIRKSLGFINRIVEEWYRLLIAYLYARRGYIVIFDRHFVYDYYHYDIQSHCRDWSSTRRMHGFLVKYVLPKPDLVICLDAPGEVVFARKREFSPEVLDVKRTQYLSLRTVISNFVVVNADRNLKLVVREISDLIYQFYRDRQDSAKKE